MKWLFNAPKLIEALNSGCLRAAGTSYSTKPPSQQASSPIPFRWGPWVNPLKGGEKSAPKLERSPRFLSLASAACLVVFQFPNYKREIKIGRRVFCSFLNEPTCWLLPEIPLKKHKSFHSAGINKKLKMQMPGSLHTQI